MSDLMVHKMNCYLLVRDDAGRSGYEQEPVFIAANFLGEALSIADAIPGMSYKGVIYQGEIHMDVRKLPEVSA